MGKWKSALEITTNVVLLHRRTVHALTTSWRRRACGCGGACRAAPEVTTMKAILCITILMLGPAVARSQQHDVQTLSSQVELVTVPVIVTSHDKHVHGLSRQQFSISQDGEAQTIAFLEEINAAPGVILQPSIAVNGFTNKAPLDQKPVLLRIIVLDQADSPYLEQQNGRRELVKFLAAHIETTDPTMLVAFRRRGPVIIHNFTTSTAVLVESLNRVKGTVEGQVNLGTEAVGNPEGSISSAIDVTRESMDILGYMNLTNNAGRGFAMTAKINCDRADSTYAAFQQLAQALSTVPGRKTLLWATAGTIPIEDAQHCMWLVDHYNDAIRSLISANIAVYPIDLLQAGNPGYADPTVMNRRPPSASYISPGAMKQFLFDNTSSYTGGTVCSFRNDLDGCFHRAVEDSKQYYLLSYYAKPTDKPVWRKIEVKVSVPDTKVRARSGYMTAGSPKTIEERRKSDVAMATLSPLDYTGLPLTAKWTQTTDSAGKKKYGFQLQVEPKAVTIDDTDQNHLKLDVIAVALDKEGKRVADSTQVIDRHLPDPGATQVRNAGFLYRGTLEVPPGDYQVKFIVRDDLSGRMGTVTAPTPKPATGGN